MWFIYALTTAFLTALETILLKIPSRRYNHFTIAITVRACASITLLPWLIWQGVPVIRPHFWITLTLAILSVSTTSILLLRAISRSDHSLVIPLTALSPIILLASGTLINKELPTTTGIVGVITMVMGAYFLGGKPQGKFLRPLQAIWSESGCRYALLVALIWGIAAPLDKLAIQQSSPLFYAFCCNALTVASLSVVRRIVPQPEPPASLSSSHSPVPWPVFLAGVIAGISLLSQLYALTTTHVSYVISIKRMSAVFAVVLGYLVFGEKNFRERLLGSTIAVTGAIVIYMFG